MFKLYLAAHTDALANSDGTMWEYHLLFNVPPGEFKGRDDAGSDSRECVELGRQIRNEITRQSLIQSARVQFQKALATARAWPKTAIFLLRSHERLGRYDVASGSFPIEPGSNGPSLVQTMNRALPIGRRSTAPGSYLGPRKRWCNERAIEDVSMATGAPFRVEIVGQESLRRLPMDRAAAETFIDASARGERTIDLEAVVEIGPIPLQLKMSAMTDTERAPARLLAARARDPKTGAVLHTFNIGTASPTTSGASPGASASPAPPSPPRNAPAPTAEAAPSPSRSAGDRRVSPATVPAPGEFRFTGYRGLLLTVRDAPQVLTPEALANMAERQIRAEHEAWAAIDRRLANRASTDDRMNPKKYSFTYEWQSEVETRPDLANGALMDTFLRTDADWSFVTKDAAWDVRFEAFAEVFLFSRAKIEGRDHRFAAQELRDVYGLHLKQASTKAPTSLWLPLPLPALTYDFQARGYPVPARRRMAGMPTRNGRPDMLEKVDDYLDSFRVPPEARDRATYLLTFGAVGSNADIDPAASKPGVPFAASPAAHWRRIPSIGASSNATPMVELLSLDRQLQLSMIPVDPGRAEAFAKRSPGMPGVSGFTARLHFEAERVVLGERGRGRDMGANAVLLARVNRIDVFGPDGTLMTSIPASALPAASGTPVTTSSVSPSEPRTPPKTVERPSRTAPGRASATKPAGTAPPREAPAPAAPVPPRTSSGAGLSSLAGTYAGGTVDFTVSSTPAGLTLVAPGQPTIDLEPASDDGMRYSMKGKRGHSVEFRRDATGVVTELISVQPGLTMVSIRVTGERLDPGVLASLAGEYALTPTSPVLTVAVEGSDLTLLIPGQPMHRLRYAHGLRFSVVNMINASVEFKRGANGLGSELVIRQAHGNAPAFRR